MAIDLMSHKTSSTFAEKTDTNEVENAANSGLQTIENLITVFSNQTHRRNPSPSHGQIDDYGIINNATVTELRKIISLLDRT
ncbi:hypothetical protein RHMOL_Rhmol13G0034700 [Rhododendron molle]|uniref:Uncharacterized protein n=1 Tax=Rhododendron molle TaxID=49168 RepID=A0ACC0L2I6_RHOML|nr:hypothetical protein RHMOL_Rhmol13G0034700 [Rhododendron molle]